MLGKMVFDLRLGLILGAVVVLGLLTACSQTQAETPTPEGVHIQLLVTSPSQPLPLNQPVNVISRTEDPTQQVSHVELYAVEWPSKETEGGDGKGDELLVRSDAADFSQTVFTAYQRFVPTEPGRYGIKVVGYNKLGYSAVTGTVEFEVE
jgi:hypothetical protein